MFPESQESQSQSLPDGHEPAGAGQAEASASPAGPAGPDAPASNTASDNYGPGDIKLLRFGVDSLYLSYQGELAAGQEKALEALKDLAQSPIPGDSAFAAISANGHHFEVKDKARRLFSFALEDGCYRIDLSRGKGKLPLAYCKVASDYLCIHLPEQAERDLYDTLSGLGDARPDPNVSRIDLFLDFACGLPMNGWAENAWVTKAARVHHYTENGRFTGWGLGQGAPLLCRLYDKTCEIRLSGKEYLQDLWSAQGWNPGVPVWRLEFQFRTEVLRQLGLLGFSRVNSSLKGLWAYAMDYFRLTVPNTSDKNRSRWPTHALWKALSAVDWEGNGGPLYRSFSPIRAPSLEFIARQGFGAITSFMAREGFQDFIEAIDAFVDMVLTQTHERAHRMGLSFDGLVDETVALKRRRYNVASDQRDVTQEIEDAEIARRAREYKRRSDGE